MRSLLTVDLVISELVAINDAGLVDDFGDRSDWIEIHNPTGQQVSLGGWHLTDDPANLTKWTFPSITLAANGYLVVWASDQNRAVAGQPLHTSFKLSGDGEYLALMHPDGAMIAAEFAPSFPPQTGDVSYGLTAALDEEGYFSPPTPGAANGPPISDPPAPLPKVADTKFGGDPAIQPPVFRGRGYYDAPFDVVLSTATAGADVRYTTDGSVPTATHGAIYSTPIQITRTTTLRAAAFKAGYEPTNVDTQTYLFAAGVLQQPAAPAGFPAKWGAGNSDDPLITADYQVDPRITQNAGSPYLDRLADALSSIPSVSLVMPVGDWFDPATGIYSNRSKTGDAWERAASVEWIFPGEGDDFQANGGVRILGASSALPGVWKVPKLSLRLTFKEEFGPKKLHADLFPGSPVDEFNALVFDARSDFSWLDIQAQQCARAEYIRDQYVSDLLLAMSQPATRGAYVHVYLDGIYWGLFDMHERPDEHFNADYFGGQPSDYDALKHPVLFSGTTPELLHGTMAAWNAAQAIAAAGLASDAAYQNLQQYVDVDNLIDYMIANFYAGTGDWPGLNWYAARSRATGEGFRFFSWDAEYTLMELNANQTGVNTFNSPAYFYDRLRANAEFRLRFADHVQRQFFNGGPLYVNPNNPAWNSAQPQNNRPAATFDQRVREIDTAIIMESARWGDYRRPAAPYTRDVEWVNEISALDGTYFPQRSAIVVQQLRSKNLYFDTTPAPTFSVNGLWQFGGTVTAGSLLTMSEVAGTTVYYTFDGTDPRTYLAGTPAGLPFADPIPLDDNIHVKARRRNNSSGQWSPLSEATFVLDVPPTLRVTELMYHPADPPAGSPYQNSDFEFIELTNVGSQPLNLADLHFTVGIDFDFATGSMTSLAAGESVVVVENAAAFATRYETTDLPIVGEYFGELADGGETLRLSRRIVGTTSEQLVQEFTFDDAWHATTDGGGHSLVVVDSSASPDAWSMADGWRASQQVNGSPGRNEPASVAARQVFYNDSSWDGNDSTATPEDDASIATDKSALLPGQAATLANYTSYAKGINGILIDVQNLAGTVTASDFAFKTGNVNDVSTWTQLATPPSISVRLMPDGSGGHRVTLSWPNGTIAKTWLEVTMRANANTGLASDDVFYFGNAVGESGNSAIDAQVNAADELAARGNPRNIANPAPVTFLYDYNRDKQVNAADQLIARGNTTNLATALRFISPATSARAAFPVGAGLADAALAAALANNLDRGPTRRLRRR